MSTAKRTSHLRQRTTTRIPDALRGPTNSDLRIAQLVGRMRPFHRLWSALEKLEI